MTYYVYALVDPVTEVPFYIGKGKWTNQRHLDHLRETESTTANRFKFYKIRSIRQNGNEPQVCYLKQNIENEEEAYLYEEEMISTYRRRSEGGSLTNICTSKRPPDQTGRPKSEEHRKKLSEAHKGRPKSVSHLNSLREVKKRKALEGTLVGWPKSVPRSEETKKLISDKRKNCTNTPESNIKRSESLKGKPWSDARRNAPSKKSGPKKGSGWSEARRRAHEEKKNGKRL